MKVNLQKAVNVLSNRKINFLQPLYETIVNSIEAGASDIKVIFDIEKTLDHTPNLVNSYTVIDNGEGFTQKNRDAFLELWTNNKIKLGAKGSGRFTWLNIFKHVEIESMVASEGCKVNIPFNINFDDSDLNVEDLSIEESKTVVRLYDIVERKRDIRVEANAELIKKAIIDHLLLKLVLLKEEGRHYVINLHLDDEELSISPNDIPDLKESDFTVDSDITNEVFDFQMHYEFFDDQKSEIKAFYCANFRTVKEINLSYLGINGSFPNNSSLTLLVTSEYFDERDDDSRNELPGLKGLKDPNLDNPVTLKMINTDLKDQLRHIIFQEYPELIEATKRELEKARDEAPHLAIYFETEDDIIGDKDVIIKNARKKFENSKSETRMKFQKILKKNNVPTDNFIEAINEVSTVAAAELAEYILYRDQITDALEKSLSDESKNESFIHNLFMPMKTDSFRGDDSYLQSNLWLLDDKFMTYYYAASDKTVNQIKNELGIETTVKADHRRRPDLTVYYNTDSEYRNAVVVEIKGVFASNDEKNKAITELPNNVVTLRQNIEKTGTIWSYIITDIDSYFAQTIENQDRYTLLFNKGSEYKVYYAYFERNDTHQYIVDIKTIVRDAKDRNVTFLDILKNRSN
ncbi:ATP-binding protein [Candidatus Xianfuyuplasma coldseepsis]|uniref:ATP-binding protein n=1 Tax=Candidatus Xianfuyuplasma coldseepsis TaxID=2782163 RepID=A0A7L7KRQ3_9MOLU|nr:ATP-binding protein [Xianfuyuplasma coldseepsis]QMS85275.1 hypothetical protein G4Z02_05765 [Xianfuyuplasma coldseepsis]